LKYTRANSTKHNVLPTAAKTPTAHICFGHRLVGLAFTMIHACNNVTTWHGEGGIHHGGAAGSKLIKSLGVTIVEVGIDRFALKAILHRVGVPK